ncbi:N(6)-adenine-specific methyltransferase METTL4 isoform X2 [Maniola jurtina]|uniref:N(6)-adenine-specific methyltransferase METTL4 isoform X2 n=1 Tax=Maniola jurtina TaxID=191418 RepID=UPI001E68B36A|nr:N(6)-adenine-specific methyltransferase METTL4 isoform X2 [Maniola jurtina]
MSVLFNNNNLRFIDHRDFLANIYKNVNSELAENQNLTFNKKLFCIKSTTNNLIINKKRSRESDQILEEVTKVKQMYNELIAKLPSEVKVGVSQKYDLLETSLVRELAQKHFESTIFHHHGLSGGNNSDTPLKCKIKDDCFLIPQNSRFFCGCVKEQCAKLNGNKFDIMIADPPWWNKYIRRLKGANNKLSYSMMYNEEIASIPVQDLLSENCLIAVWCTNALSNINAIKNLIFPKWGVEYVTTWYWLKLTIDLKPLCEFGSGCKKQPYERIVIGKVGNVCVPSDLLVASVPSALHSHKPPLLDLLTPCIDEENPQILELFARYLLPNTTSVGYEPLKWQHLSLYEEAVDVT